MIKVTLNCRGETARCGLSCATLAACDAVAANPGRFCDASRRITRTSSSTERPLRAARSRSSALMASSSLRMVRLAMARVQMRQQRYHNMIALQSDRKPPHRKQDGNEGDGDDPQRDGAPAVLAPFGAAE